jgi:hypothetical protein
MADAKAPAKNNPYDLYSIGMMATSGLQSFGEIYQGISDMRNLQFSAAQADTNAKLMDWAAEDAKSKGESDQKKLEQQIDSLVGEQKTDFAASGVDVTTGAPVDIMADTLRAGAADQAMIRRNAIMEAFGYKVKGIEYKAQAKQLRAQARSELISSIVSGSSTFASGMLNAYQYKKEKGSIGNA